MPKIDASTPRSPITIQEIPGVFMAAEPYTEGHELTANEAAVLNQTRAENLRNNFAPTVKEEKELAEKEGRAVNLEKLVAEFEAYQAEYEFGARRGGARSLDPLQAAIRDIGRDAVRKALRKQGVKLAEVSTREIDELVEQAIAKPENAWILDLAKRRVEEDKEMANLTVAV